VSAKNDAKILDLYQGLAVAAVSKWATAEKPFVSFAKVVVHAAEFEDKLKLQQLRKLMKTALKRLIEHKILRAKKDSFGLTKRGAGLAAPSKD
jgi:hypothetical protein